MSYSITEEVEDVRNERRSALSVQSQCRKRLVEVIGNIVNREEDRIVR